MISRIIKVEIRIIGQGRDLDYSGYHKKTNLIIVLLYVERMQKLGSHVSASSLTASNTNRAKLT